MHRTCIKGKTQTNKKKINVFACMCCHLLVCVTHRKKKNPLIVVVECALVYCLLFIYLFIYYFFFLGVVGYDCSQKISKGRSSIMIIWAEKKWEKATRFYFERERERESKVHQNLWGEGRTCYDIWNLYLPLSSPPKSTKIHDLRKSFKFSPNWIHLDSYRHF